MQQDIVDPDRDILAALVQDFEAAESSTSDSRTERERERDYVNGYQWTDDEIATLEKRGQPVVTNNRIGPKVRTLKGLETQQRTLPRAFPRTPKEEDGANAATDSLRYVMEDQRWDRTRSECFDNYIVEGQCGVDVRVVEKYGEPCIEVLQIPWDRMWGDVHSRGANFGDGKVKGQVLWMDVEDANEQWPDKADILASTMASVSTATGQTYEDVPRTRWADPKRKRVLIVEAWKREGRKVFHTIFTKGGILSREESPYLNEDGEPEDGFVFGSCFIDRDGNRFGVVKDWMSIQDEINKRRSKAMHLVNTRQTFGNQATGEKNELRKQLARADGHVELQGDAKFGEDFGVIPTGDMAQAQFELLQESKNEIDAVGVNAALSGTEKRQMSGRALIQRSEQGLAELGPVFDGFKQFQLDVYRKVWNRIRQYWTAEKWIRVTDDEKNVRFVGLNQPLTLGEQLLEEFKRQPGVSPEQVAQAEAQARMDPRMQTIVGTKNKVAELDVDIILDDAPAAANIQAEQFEAITNIAPAIASAPPWVAELLVEASNLRNKDRLLKKIRGEGDEASPQVMAMQQQMAQMGQALQEAQRALAEKDIALQQKDLAVARKELDAQAAQLQADPELTALRGEIASEAEALKHERELLARDRALFEAQKRIAILEVKAAETSMAHTAQDMDRAAGELSQAAQDAQQATGVETIQA